MHRANDDEARPELVMPPDEGVLFLTQDGEALSPNRLTQLVRDYVNAAETGKTGACHLFRHTCATLMLEGGADIRYIQEMLGHVELSTTQIYTQVSIRRLKSVHALTHPSAKIDRPMKTEVTNGAREEMFEQVPSLVAYGECEGLGVNPRDERGPRPAGERRRRADGDAPSRGRRRTRGCRRRLSCLLRAGHHGVDFP
jgi:hypothetical protein